MDEQINQPFEYERTALMLAADEGRIEDVKKLLSAKADVNVLDLDFETALMRAAKKGHIEIVKILMEADADVNLSSKYGWTALNYAVYENHFEIAKLIISAGADINKRSGGFSGSGFAVEWASEGGFLEMTKLLLAAGARITGDKYKLLEFAARGGNIEIARLLLEKGLEINEPSDESHPLGAAAESGRLEMVKYLLAAGADINIKSREWLQTALIKAAKQGQSEIVKFLIDAGADIDAEDSEGRTALMWAKFFTLHNKESDVLDQFPETIPNLTNYMERFGLYWSKKLLQPICPKCFVPFQMRESEKGELSVFRCLIEGKNYSAKFFDGTELSLYEAQRLVADIIYLYPEE